MAWNVSHSFHATSGSLPTKALIPRTAAGCHTMIVRACASFAPPKNAAQSMPGAFVSNSARDHGLFAFVRSADSCRVACTRAIFVSSATMVAAAAAGLGTFASASVRPTCAVSASRIVAMRADASR